MTAKRHAFVAGLAWSGAALLQPVTAQVATADNGGAPTIDGEIIVTAEKRSESASRVGMSLDVVGGERLDRLHLDTVQDLARQVPGLSVATAVSGIPIYNIRGVAFNTSNFSSTAPVGIYVDQVAYAFPYMASGPLFDIDRVEVLKGPQGTLYGRNTTGGLINFITNRPTRDLTGEITLEAGNYGTINSRGFVSGPLTSTVRARVAWDSEYSGDGWQHSLTRADSLGVVDRKAGRAILEWAPSSDLTATLSFNYWHDGSDTQAPQAAYHVPENAPFGIGATAAAADLLPAGGRNSQADWTPESYQPGRSTSDTRAPYRRDSSLYATALNLDYRINDTLTLTSLTGYSHLKRHDSQNQDGSQYEIFSTVQDGKIDSFSEELRLAGNAGLLDWIVGGYYSHDSIVDDNHVYLNDFSTINLLRFVAGTLNDPRYTATQIAQGFRVNDQVATLHDRSASAFANARATISDAFRISGGIRYTADRSRFAGCAADSEGNTVPVWNTAVAALAGAYPGYNIAPGQCMTFAAGAPVPAGLYRDTLVQHNVSWRAEADWTPARSTMVYASISRGYKSGAFPVIPANVASQFIPARQEEVTAYEIGAKYHSRAIRAEIAGYYNDYRNKQVFGAIADPIFSSLERLVNIPKSRTYGGEASLDITAAAGLTLHGAASYVQTDVVRYQGYDQFGHLLDFAGDEFPDTPHWQLAGSVDYQRPVSPTLIADLTLDATYQSRAHGDFQDAASYVVFPPFGSAAGTVVNARLYDIPAYALVNGSIGLAGAGGHWRVALWARNLFDRNYWTAATYSRDTIVRFMGRPRTIGASFTYKYKG